MHSTLFRSSHLFFYVGIALVLLSLVFLPTKTRVNMGSPEWPDYEDFYVGRLLAPAIGSYGLAILVLGVIEVSISTKKKLSILESIFLVSFLGFLIYVWTGFIVLSAIYVGFNAPFWWLALIINIIPSITVTLALFIGVAKKEWLLRVIEKKSVKIVVSIIMVAFPLTYTAFVLQLSVLIWTCHFTS